MTLVGYTCSDGVAHITLNRPDVANAVDLATAHALGDAVTRARSEKSAGVVLVSGAGPRFCAGGDVGSLVAASDRAAEVHVLAEALDAVLQDLAALDKPVVAAVQGAVAGAGLGLVLSCDLIVAEASTKFVFAYPSVGLTPDCGVSWLLPRAVGQQRALEIALTGRALDAHTAREWGLVTEVVDSAAIERASQIASQMAAGPAHALGRTRSLLRGSWNRTRAEAGAEESRTIADAIGTPFAENALKAFAGSTQARHRKR